MTEHLTLDAERRKLRTHAERGYEEGRYEFAALNLRSRSVECLKSHPSPFDPVMEFKSK